MNKNKYIETTKKQYFGIVQKKQKEKRPRSGIRNRCRWRDPIVHIIRNLIRKLQIHTHT